MIGLDHKSFDLAEVLQVDGTDVDIHYMKKRGTKLSPWFKHNNDPYTATVHINTIVKNLMNIDCITPEEEKAIKDLLLEEFK